MTEPTLPYVGDIHFHDKEFNKFENMVLALLFDTRDEIKGLKEDIRQFRAELLKQEAFQHYNNLKEKQE